MKNILCLDLQVKNDTNKHAVGNPRPTKHKIVSYIEFTANPTL